MKESESVSRSVMSDSLRLHGLQPARLLCPWNSPCRNTGVGSMPFFQGSSWPRDQNQVSCIAGRFFTIWATREALHKHSVCVCVCLVAQSCLTLCNHMDYSPPGSSLHGDSPGKNTGVGMPCPPQVLPYTLLISIKNKRELSISYGW